MSAAADAQGPSRLEALATRVAEALGSARGAPVEVIDLSPLSGGACQENFKVTLRGPDGAPEQFALRSDARTALPGSLNRAAEAAVMTAAHDAGVRTPRPSGFTADLVRPGAGAYFTSWVDGEAVGARVVRAPALAAARLGLTAAVATEAARIHRITPLSHAQLPIDRPPFFATIDPAEAALTFLRALFAQLARPDPALAWGLRWLAAHRPPPGAITLVHGDLRTGNLMVGPEGLTAVLDWEFAHWGDPAEDLAWLCVRDWRFGAVDQPVGGFGQRGELLAAYRAAGGVPLDAERLRWWEVAGNLRWGAATVLQGQRYFGGSPDLELLAIPTRAAEMFWESQRLIGALTEAELAPPASPADATPDPLDPAAQAQAVAAFLGDRVLPAVGADRGLAFRVRVAMHLLGGLARSLDAEADTAEAWCAAAGLAPSADAPSAAAAALDLERARCARLLMKGAIAESARPALAAQITRHLRASLAVWAPEFDTRLQLGAADDWNTNV